VTGEPDRAAWLLARHPRAGWTDHEALGPLARYWLERHAGFRQLADALDRATAELQAGRLTPAEFRAVVRAAPAAAAHASRRPSRGRGLLLFSAAARGRAEPGRPLRRARRRSRRARRRDRRGGRGGERAARGRARRRGRRGGRALCRGQRAAARAPAAPSRGRGGPRHPAAARARRGRARARLRRA
jgi:hypothetical protein